MDLSGLTAVTTAAEMKAWLAANCLSPISPVMSGSDLGIIIEKVMDAVSESSYTPAQATETAPGIVALATITEALAGTDDAKAMTALKTLALILNQKKIVSYQINPVNISEVSVYMENAGHVNSLLIAGATNAKLKIGTGGTYPSGTQTYPFSYSAGDRVFISFTYTDQANTTCNIKLKCQDN